MQEALLEVKGLAFRYEEQTVIDDISLSIYRGDKIAVMGSNGAGKSTFFLNLNGVLKPERGEIFLDGCPVKKKNMKKLYQRVGFVFQDADNQMIASNVRAEISFGPMNLGLPKHKVVKRVDDAIFYLGLKELEDRAPHYLSGGEKKSVSIADILAMESEIMIFDEPMAALDPVNTEKVELILERLHEDGKTLLIATHDVDFAYRFADRILVFSEGRLIADGTPADIFHKKDVMERAHLKEPAMMTIWEALVAAQLVTEQTTCPVTPNEVAREIAYNKEKRGMLRK